MYGQIPFRSSNYTYFVNYILNNKMYKLFFQAVMMYAGVGSLLIKGLMHERVGGISNVRDTLIYKLFDILTRNHFR